MDIDLFDWHAECFLHPELDVLHDVVSYFADSNSVFQHDVQVNDDVLIYHPDLNATAIAFTLQHLGQATAECGMSHAHNAVAL